MAEGCTARKKSGLLSKNGTKRNRGIGDSLLDNHSNRRQQRRQARICYSFSLVLALGRRRRCRKRSEQSARTALCGRRTASLRFALPSRALQDASRGGRGGGGGGVCGEENGSLRGGSGLVQRAAAAPLALTCRTAASASAAHATYRMLVSLRYVPLQQHRMTRQKLGHTRGSRF